EQEAIANAKPNPAAGAPPAVKDEKLEDVPLDPLELPELQVADGRVIDEGARRAQDQLKELNKETRSKLFQGLGPSKGLGGSGRGGAKGKGTGTGEGDLEGPGKSKLSNRQRRMLRWVMVFDTVDGRDYLKQLRGLGAILAIPDGTGGYVIIKDLATVP